MLPFGITLAVRKLQHFQQVPVWVLGVKRLDAWALGVPQGEIVFDRVGSTPQEFRTAIAKLGPECTAAVAALH